MLRSFKSLRGFAIRATDGHIGTVCDIYFDDRTWQLRYCVVDTGRVIGNRHVLVGLRALSVLDPTRRELWVRLSTSEVRRSPDTRSNLPVSKQHRRGAAALLRKLAFWSRRPDAVAPDRHLRSCRAIVGRRLDATNGTAGAIDDYMIDDKSWTIRELVVDTREAATPRLRIALDDVGGINWPMPAGVSR